MSFPNHINGVVISVVASGVVDRRFEHRSGQIIDYKIYSPKKETQHVKKYNLLQIFNIILNTEISITLHWNLAHWLFRH